MSLQNLKDRMPDYAKDTKINLGKVLTSEGSPDLTVNQIYIIALASAYTTKNKVLAQNVKAEVAATLSEAEINAAKAAATIMGMNNIYYRFATHLVGDTDYKQMPANLRMTVIGGHGIEKVDFELASLAVSIINGCGMCVDTHVREVIKAGISKIGVQSTARIASVMSAAAQALAIEEMDN